MVNHYYGGKTVELQSLPEFASLRLDSIEKEKKRRECLQIPWPPLNHSLAAFANTGLFYDTDKRAFRCHNCAIMICDLSIIDIRGESLHIIHIRLSPGCSLMGYMLGDPFVNIVTAEISCPTVLPFNYYYQKMIDCRMSPEQITHVCAVLFHDHGYAKANVFDPNNTLVHKLTCCVPSCTGRMSSMVFSCGHQACRECGVPMEKCHICFKGIIAKIQMVELL